MGQSAAGGGPHSDRLQRRSGHTTLREGPAGPLWQRLWLWSALSHVQSGPRVGGWEDRAGLKVAAIGARLARTSR